MGAAPDVWPDGAAGSASGGATALDEQLRELGIWRVPVPTPYPGEPVNVYVVEDEGGGLALVDSGVTGRPVLGALAEALWRSGSGFSDVRRIVITHGHADHFGAAQSVVDHAGGDVPVLAHPGDFVRMTEAGPRWRELLPHYRTLLERHGVPPALFSPYAAREIEDEELHAARVREVRPLRQGEVLRFRRFEATVLHLPGHTPGLVCLFDAAHGLLFSNDHLLERITPGLELHLGPGGEELPFGTLGTYLESLRSTRALGIHTVLPGHGAPFRGHQAAVDAVLRIHAARQSRVLEVLARGSASAFTIARALFPRMAGVEPMATLAQVVGNLELLQARGAVRREELASGWTYRIVG